MGEGLKAQRLALGFSLRDVEEITKGRISNAYLSQLETGKIKNPSIGVARELAAAYAVPVEMLIGWMSEPPVTIPPALCPTCGRAMISP